MQFEMSALTFEQRYKLLTASVTPRPIAWVTTQSAAGTRNAAPYSFFNVMAADPPLVAIGMMRRTDGALKDTTSNIIETGEFVVNLVRYADRDLMNFSCIDAPPEFDELAIGGISVAPSVAVAPPRIASAPVSMECRIAHRIDVSATATVVLGEVVMFHIDNAFVDPATLRLDTPALDLIARMHGDGIYARPSELFQMKRPAYGDMMP